MKDRMSLDESTRKAYLNALGIQQWRTRDSHYDDIEEITQVESASKSVVKIAVEKQAEPGDVIQSAMKVDVEKISKMDLSTLELHVRGCDTCDLHKTRKQTVFGVGHHKADWLIIGEAPGADEDKQGEPFVGRAGQLLTQMLRAIGLAREEVFIANILKCRPPNNRDPKSEEVNACSAYLNRQIELLEPKIILALGRIAAQSILQSNVPIGKMRGKLYHYEKNNIPTVVTYHPAYLLRSPKEKRKVWEDLKFARKQIIT
ncbi:MAG: uracil-DNA glycosylase [Gammaproteobacteria bacterium]|nr:uracil-DNA glycosylase [Gammaproteobacteria bacterium]